jgi:predicted dinucleotide-binding enzyme
VKALNLFAAESWLAASEVPRTVAICGDDPTALAVTQRLIGDLGGTPATFGGLEHARQLEDVAGFVMRLVATGHDPASAVPAVQPQAA